MKKIIIFSIIGLAFIGVLVWFGKMNSKSPIQFETEKPFKTDIVRKTVATGKVTPVEEIEIKPQVSGIKLRGLVQPFVLLIELTG